MLNLCVGLDHICTKGWIFFCSSCVMSSWSKTTSKSFVTKGDLMQHPLWDKQTYFGAFKDIRAWFRKRFISLLIVSRILWQYWLYVSTLPPLHFIILFRLPIPLQSISSVSILTQTSPKRADVILERSLKASGKRGLDI